jgi:dynein intermediate chain 2, axonemal
MIGGGCYNGLVAIWDVKRHSSQPALVSPVEKSHSDPITHLSWLSMKTGTELITSSTDGRVFWWDTRQMAKGPIDILLLTENVEGKERVVGGSVIEFNAEAGANKFLVGTE